ncbi:Endonuclease IV [Anaerosporobacter mobilis DSM 15930]|jgi:deoxyribonuclease-4|uniref:Probable endonuclease 4 n=1 Tax=Anaerosporobacter mobilis DSM 15930 TaxID=1120996 RepID=A0A1M7ESP5_9FIRM|nr:deoxyribonuclease IV [Anaerosporobacter mobilis]SHL94781.1 Endonuclease IV [Anaerosporobacter mobilis DSM 15930]
MNEYQLKIGSHVGMSGKEMFLGSAKEAASYGANALMVYTGAPQNTRRKAVSELNIEAGQAYMKEHGLQDLIIHAPYIINLGNSVKPETFELAVDFLALELERTKAMGSKILVLHPGAHVGAGEDIGTSQIIKGLNEVLTSDTEVYVTLETMAGKGSEIGRNFEELARIYDGVHHNDKLRICFDTCHVHDSGLDIVNDFDGVIDKFDKIIGKDQIAVFHINDSKNPRGAGKDRHENIGFGHIGFDAIHKIVYHPEFESIPKILETPYIPSVEDPKKTYAPYKHEIAMLRIQDFNPKLRELVLAEQK